MAEQVVEQAAGTESSKDRYIDLIFEGGGIKGIALVGAYSVLEERGFEPQNVAGTSIGALVATLLAAGWSASELREVIGDLDFRRFRDRAWEDRIPLIGRSLSILRDQGMYEGEAVLEWISEKLEAKGVRTFKDLVHPQYADQPQYRYKVQVVASDLTTRELLVLPRDAYKLGVEADELSVALAVRMSTSIPIFFEPVRFRNPKTGREHIIVDGGMLSNFPVWLFDADGVPEWPSFGMLLVEQEPPPEVDLARRRLRWRRFKKQRRPGGEMTNILRFSKSLLDTMMQAHDRRFMGDAALARTINIPIVGVSATDLSISPEVALQLYDSGRQAAEQFLDAWDFQEYIQKYRIGPA